MFRFGWIELTAREVVERSSVEIAKDAWRRLNSITTESFNQGIRTEQAVLVAFEKSSALQKQVKESMEKSQKLVAPQIAKSFEAKDTTGILDALKVASDINWKFHRACAQRYLDIVSKHMKQRSGPLDAV